MLKSLKSVLVKDEVNDESCCNKLWFPLKCVPKGDKKEETSAVWSDAVNELVYLTSFCQCISPLYLLGFI